MSEEKLGLLGWLRRALLGAATLVVLFLGAVWFLSNRARSKDYGAPLHGLAIPVPPPEDTAAIEEGQRLATIYGCLDCHTANLGGQIFIDEPAFVVLPAPNITTGRGGSRAVYDPALWERAIRHGIGAEGNALMIMPSGEYNLMSDQELALILAYARNTDPVSSSPGPFRLGIGGRMALAMGAPIVAAKITDHEAPHIETKPEGVSLDWGRRYGLGCRICHGDDYAGGLVPGAPEDAPPAPNITSHETGLGAWTLEQFKTALRTGVRPDGRQLNPLMPWPLMARLTDDELESLWQYLETLDPVAEKTG
jgi:mono/diheme cytochrome c family protein